MTAKSSGGQRFVDMVAHCHQEDRGAFMPFLVIGDPTFDASLALADALVEAGADGLELGLPFSDPPADGPVVQAANNRALADGMTPERGFEWIAKVREKHDLPTSMLVYMNLVMQYGVDAFFARAAQVGLDAILIADLPPEHGDEVVQAARTHGVASVFLASELSTQERLERIGEGCDGYVYALARVGVTGERTAVNTGLGDSLSRMEQAIAYPRLVGFGISSPEHVRAALTAGADGVIVGSAIVRCIEPHTNDPQAACQAVAERATSLAQATRGLAALRERGTPC